MKGGHPIVLPCNYYPLGEQNFQQSFGQSLPGDNTDPS